MTDDFLIGKFSGISVLGFYRVFTNKLLEKNVNHQYNITYFSGETNPEITESIR
jgi:hypothetical protein